VAIHVTNDGDVIVAGYSQGDGTGYDYVVIRLTSTNQLVWSPVRYNLRANDIAADMAVDSNGHIYVTGYTWNGGSDDTEFLTIGLDSSGAMRSGWPQVFDAAGGTDEATGIAVHTDGSVFVTGYSTGDPPIEGVQYATLRYQGNGSLLWKAFLDPYQTSKGSRARDIALDIDGNAFVTGESAVSFSGGVAYHNYATVAYKRDGIGGVGQYLWSPNPTWRGYDGPPGGEDDRAVAIRTIREESPFGGYNTFVYVTGKSTGSGTGYDIATLKYDGATGSPQWSGTGFHNGAKRYETSADDQGRALFVAGAGNVYVVGNSGNDYITVRYDKSGSQRWNPPMFYSTAYAVDIGRAVAVSCAGVVHVTGLSEGGSSTLNDFATVLYTQVSSSQSDGFTITTGTLLSGNLASLHNPDSNYLEVREYDDGTGGPRVIMEFTIASPYNNPSELCFEYQAYITDVGLGQVVRLWDWDSGAWVTLDSRNASTAEQVLFVWDANDPGRFVKNDGSRLVKAQVYYPFIDEVSPGWKVFVNVARWYILPP